MSNRIVDVVVVNHRLDPVETELHVHVKLDELTATAELKGRLIGPRSALASTIEIAYPLREIERAGHIVLRVVIPEPGWWSPQTPFLYEGPLELWQDGALRERITIRHGIRTLQLSAKGLRFNGKPLTIRGKMARPGFNSDDAKALHDAGFNAIGITLGAADISPWEIADRAGLLVLGSAPDLAIFHALRHDLVHHPSQLGWIFNRNDLPLAPLQDKACAMLYGINTSAANQPEHADFLVCHENELAWLGDLEMPKLVATGRLPEAPPTRADVIGWMETN